MSSAPLVSVIIPARDSAPTLDRTLAAVCAQTVRAPYEVIVVDDGSVDATAAIALRYAPQVTLVRSEQGRGPGAARNQGVAIARGTVLAFTDADCFPRPEWLAAGLQALGAADLVQGKVVPDPSEPRTPFDRSLEVSADGGFYQTANLFVSRELFDAVGGFRDWALERPGRPKPRADRRRARAARTPIGEDTLFAWTALRRGHRSGFAAAALVDHAVVPGSIADAMADRWHWTRDMPGLVKLVPELRERILYRRIFFGDWTAQFDLAAAGVLTALLIRRPWPLLLAAPYARRLHGEAAGYVDEARSAVSRRHRRAFLLGAPLVDAVTLAGFIVGSRDHREVVI